MEKSFRQQHNNIKWMLHKHSGLPILAQLHFGWIASSSSRHYYLFIICLKVFKWEKQKSSSPLLFLAVFWFPICIIICNVNILKLFKRWPTCLPVAWILCVSCHPYFIYCVKIASEFRFTMWLNSTKGTSCLLLKIYLTEDLTIVPMIPNSWKLKWYFWKYKLYKVCISFYFIFILYTILFIISE